MYLNMNFKISNLEKLLEEGQMEEKCQGEGSEMGSGSCRSSLDGQGSDLRRRLAKAGIEEPLPGVLTWESPGAG